MGVRQDAKEKAQENCKVRGVAAIALLSWQRSCKRRFGKSSIFGKYPVFSTASCAFSAPIASNRGHPFQLCSLPEEKANRGCARINADEEGTATDARWKSEERSLLCLGVKLSVESKLLMFSRRVNMRRRAGLNWNWYKNLKKCRVPRLARNRGTHVGVKGLSSDDGNRTPSSRSLEQGLSRVAPKVKVRTRT
jgi:hypothetical protein